MQQVLKESVSVDDFEQQLVQIRMENDESTEPSERWHVGLSYPKCDTLMKTEHQYMRKMLVDTPENARFEDPKFWEEI